MSARKLQQEFDKTNKKIAEGLGAFDDIFDKLMTTEIASQREKLESDLKKEIKKLQRSRDQLKQWLGDGSIKLDKNLLQENRTRIEHAMDSFKDLEKSSKIKQFSNEGLELQSQRSLRFNKFSDPEDYKKHEQFNYISDVIEQLHSQNDGLEEETHALSVHLKRAKSSHASAIQTEIDDAKYKVERNNGHIKKLEMILRGLENDNLDPDRIDDIKDDLEYYVENNNEEDYVEYDDFYEQLDIDDDSLEVHGSLAQMALDGVEAEAAAAAAAAEARDSADASTAAAVAGAGSPGTVSPANASLSNLAAANLSASSVSSPPPVAKSEVLKKKGIVPAPNPPPLVGHGSYSSAIKAAQGIEAPREPTGTIAEAVGSQRTPASQSAQVKEGQQGQTAQSQAAQSQTTQSQTAPQAPPAQTAPTHAQAPHSVQASPTAAKDSTRTLGGGIGAAAISIGSSSASARFFDTISRFAGLHQSRLNNPLPFESVGHLLESSLLNCPDSFDAEKPRQYNPVKIHPSSIDYPQEPMYELNSAHLMRKFDNDTLFFCFYYSEGSENFAKWNAARELSRRGWAFHGETHQWFMKDVKHTRNRSSSTIQREDAESPVADVAEAGDGKEENYKYFDYEKTWLTRRRDNYRFTGEMRYQFV